MKSVICIDTLGVEGVFPNRRISLVGVENDLPAMEPLSQFADSYILAQAGEELLLIDQHALHERFVTNVFATMRVCGRLSLGWYPQELNYTCPASSFGIVFGTLQELGFLLEKVEEGHWDVMQAPRLLDGDEVEPFLLDLLQDISEDGAPLETIERRKDHLAFLNACRGVCQGQRYLTIAQMRRLLEDMRNVQIHGHVCMAVQRLCVYRWIPLTSTSVGMAERRVRNSGSAILCSLGPSTVAPVCVASKTAVIWIR